MIHEIKGASYYYRRLPQEILTGGWTLLHCAAAIDKLSVFNALCKYTKDLPHIKDCEGRVPTKIAELCWSYSIINVLKSKQYTNTSDQVKAIPGSLFLLFFYSPTITTIEAATNSDLNKIQKFWILSFFVAASLLIDYIICPWVDHYKDKKYIIPTQEKSPDPDTQLIFCDRMCARNPCMNHTPV